MAIGIGVVTIASIFVECILYGLFLSLFAASSVILIQRIRKGGKILALVVSIVMFIVSTIHIGIDLRRLLDAFIKHPTTSAENLLALNTPLYSVKSTAYVIQTLIGDGFILFRLHIVWKGDKRIVVPLVFPFIASIGVGIGILRTFAVTSSTEPVFGSQLHNLIVSFFALTLFTNFSATSLLAGRIWWVHRKVLSTMTKGGSLMPVATVIIESGAIYSACLIILLSLYLSASYAQYIALDALVQVIGIVFSLIIIRVGLDVSGDTSKSTLNLSVFSPDNGGSSGTAIRSSRPPPKLQSVSIKIATTVDREFELTPIGYSKALEEQTV